MKKTLLVLALFTTATIGLVISSTNIKKINTDNIKIDIKSLYMEDPNDPKTILAETKRATFSVLQEGDTTIYKHDPVCQAGVFLPDKNGVVKCTFCGRSE